jgi:hypothetical protein
MPAMFNLSFAEFDPSSPKTLDDTKENAAAATAVELRNCRRDISLFLVNFFIIEK